ncbi:MAG: hypothetical protein WA091_01690 [Minisyncoccales bacterium]
MKTVVGANSFSGMAKTRVLLNNLFEKSNVDCFVAVAKKELFDGEIIESISVKIPTPLKVGEIQGVGAEIKRVAIKKGIKSKSRVVYWYQLFGGIEIIVSATITTLKQTRTYF